MRTTERVVFRLIQMPCCGHLLCWVNPRYPTYCPQCGKFVYDRVKGCVLSSDGNAMLKCDLVDKPPQEDSEVEQLRSVLKFIKPALIVLRETCVRWGLDVGVEKTNEMIGAVEAATEKPSLDTSTLRVGQVIEVDWVGGWHKFWVTSLDKETVTIASLERAPIRFDRRNLPKWRPAP